MSRIHAVLPLLLLGAALACDPPAPVKGAGIPPEWPRPQYDRVEIRVGGHPVEVEIADTAVKRRYGYMFVATPPSDREGMLFVYPEPAPLTFWMRNTRIPLDLLFIADDGRILNAHRDMEPLDETPARYRALEPCRYALELRGGWLAANDVWLGAKVEIPAAIRERVAEPNDPDLEDIPRVVTAR
jgi:uncharacterized membrane protein (UPF0127 family)